MKARERENVFVFTVRILYVCERMMMMMHVLQPNLNEFVQKMDVDIVDETYFILTVFTINLQCVTDICMHVHDQTHT